MPFSVLQAYPVPCVYVLVPARTRFIFAVGWRGNGWNPESILYHLTLPCRGRGKGSLPGWGERGDTGLSLHHDHLHVNCLCLSCAFFFNQYCCCCCLLFYLIDVSSNLFISQLTIFSFSASDSLFHPAAGKREREGWVKEWCLVWSGFIWNPTLGTTIPEPRESTSGHEGSAKILSSEYNIYFCFILSSYAAIQTFAKWYQKKSLSGFLAGNACEWTSWPKALMCWINVIFDFSEPNASPVMCLITLKSRFCTLWQSIYSKTHFHELRQLCFIVPYIPV